MTQLEKKERESRRLVPALDLLSQNLRKGAGLGFIFAQWGWLPVNWGWKLRGSAGKGSEGSGSAQGEGQGGGPRESLDFFHLCFNHWQVTKWAEPSAMQAANQAVSVCPLGVSV